MAFSAAAGTNPSSQVLTVTAGRRPASPRLRTKLVEREPDIGHTAANLSVNVSSSNLTAGTITASSRLTPTHNAERVGEPDGHRFWRRDCGQCHAAPTSLAFTGLTGSGNLPVQSVQVNSASGSTGVSFTTLATTTSGGNWLSTSAGGSSITTPFQMTVTVNTGGLAAGTYNATSRFRP